MQDFIPTVVSVVGVFLLMGTGAFCRRRDWLTPEADRSLANLTANVMLPAYFANRILTSPQFDSAAAAWTPPFIGFGMTAMGFAVSFTFARLLGRFVGLETDAKQRAFALCAGICNYGYIPLPLAESAYPDAVIELILHNVGVDLALWSIGLAIISGSAGDGQWKRAIFSPPFMAVIIASVVRQIGVDTQIPTPVVTVLGKLGGCAVPMGLMLSGAIIVDFLRGANWKGSARTVLSAIGIRQLLIPVMMLGLTVALGVSVDMKQVMMLQAAMPAAVFPIVLVRLYDQDSETALRVVLSTSLAGIVLIPVWLALGAWWLGV
ncbi:Membrane transport protein [Rubripirellula tenax]|uniref:Membrane transport protein n=1 Tax=Rubripirellula tenax TaxID=2528015 RepID=A0A5C6FAS7_9BACT|nr:AEC family transporter [Rubripirellula tenax]TWU58498.1 Membrane transport protein [Rubripirellula tenax]